MGENLSISEKSDSMNQMGQQMLNKVPKVTIFFWVINIMATALGGRAADYLKNNLNFGLTNTTIIAAVLLIISLGFQIKKNKYVPVFYWLTVVFVSIFVTLGSDSLTVYLGIPRLAKTIVFFAIMAVTFLVWYLSESTLSIHSIYTTKREAFYWLAILFSFALGTAAGDWISEVLSLNYFSSVLLFAAIIGLVTIVYKDYKLNSLLTYWITCILTRPFSVSLVGFLSQPFNNGGLGLGSTGTSFIFLLTLVLLVIYLAKTKKDKSLLIS